MTSQKQVLRHYLPELKKHKVWVFLSLLGIFLVTLVELNFPIIFRYITDALAEGPDIAYEKAMIGFWWFFGMWFTVWALWRINEYALLRLEVEGMRDITIRCFQKLEKHSSAFFANTFTGSLVRKIGRFTYAFEGLYDTFYFNFFPQALRILFFSTLFTIEKPLLGGIFVIWAITFLLGNYYFSVWKLKYEKAAAKADSKIGAVMADSFGNVQTVKSFSGEGRELKRCTEVSNDHMKKQRYAWILDNYMFAFQTLFMMILEITFVYLLIKWWKEGTATVGDFVLFQTSLIFIMRNLLEFGRNIRNWYTHIANATEMAEIFEKPVCNADIEGVKDIHISQGEIEIKNMSFRYEKEESSIFEDFSLHIPAGQTVALVGHSGSGKSSLVKLLLHLYSPQLGKILIDGQNILERNQNSLRQGISLVPQSPELFHRSIAENIAYGKADATMEEIIEAAKKADAHEFIQNLSEGYDTLVGERGVKLSGGEKQRLAIARVILKDAKILILDEATSALDSITEAKIQHAIENAIKGKTAIVIAHRLSTIQSVDRVIVMEKGKIVEDGSHEELIENNGVFAKMWKQQSGGFLGE